MQQRLIAASGAGDISTVRKLLRKNVPTGLKDEYGRTALSFASSAGHSEIVRILLEAGAEVNQQLGSNVTALHAAAKKRHRIGCLADCALKYTCSFSKALLSPGGNRFKSNTDNQATTVKHLILCGAELDAINYNNITPIGLCQYHTDTWSILRNASKGNMPDIGAESEVPTIPPHSLPAVTVETKKSGKEKRKGIKGKKGKKSGKRTGKRKGKKK